MIKAKQLYTKIFDNLKWGEIMIKAKQSCAKINESPIPDLLNFILGTLLFFLMFFTMLVIWASVKPQPAQINSNSPTLEATIMLQKP